jgi:uncharacterized protein YbjT (DUF2867 family)
VPTERSHKRVLVAGATGRLGVIVHVLLDRGHSVRALTRNPTSRAAARLFAAGADVVYGDFDDPESIAAAAAGADAVFATGTAHRAGPRGELRHGRTIAGAAATAGVPHLVYSSGDGAAPDSTLPLFQVKHEIEQYVRSLPIAHTILAPVYFMENLFNPWNLAALRAATFPSPIPIELPLQQVAIADLATFGAIAIERADEFAGARVAIASDELTAERAAHVLARVLGRDLTAGELPSEELPPGLRALFDWLERTPHNVDLGVLHDRYPEVGWHDYEAWAHSQLDLLRRLCPGEHAGVR